MCFKGRIDLIVAYMIFFLSMQAGHMKCRTMADRILIMAYDNLPHNMRRFSNPAGPRPRVIPVAATGAALLSGRRSVQHRSQRLLSG